MKLLVFLFLLASLSGLAHPGVGIVKNNKGHIFYTDLQQVWMIANGVKKVVVPNVHTHELYVDKNDNLYGESGIYNSTTDKHYHYLWVYRPTGQIDTVIGLREAYVQHDFSLARDRAGNEYYTKQFLQQPDTTHIYKKSPGGIETVFATGRYKGVTWLHPQPNGSVLYAANNNLYRVDTAGHTRLIKEGIGNKTPSFSFSDNSTTIWGIWEDAAQNVYVAVFSDQTIKRIGTDGRVSDYYTSTGNWAPLHGVFDNQQRLWVLEGSDKNEVRVTLVELSVNSIRNQTIWPYLPYLITGILLAAILFLLFGYRKNWYANIRKLSK